MALESTRKTVASPEDVVNTNVFVINDIDLKIPPENIAINKENLNYSWRTLRTNIATKIPSGRGQTSVHLSIPFTPRQLLSLHRLIVEFKHSPFCYVENRFLRESLVPDWPYFQNMAFTMTSLEVKPYPGSSDTLLVELDLIWFNYFPYTYNWVYREDWQTNWIYSEPVESGDLTSYSIGWEIDPDTYERYHSPSVVEKLSRTTSTDYTSVNRAGLLSPLITGLDSSVLFDEWSLVQAKYKDKNRKTIYDMQVNHAGVEFDLLPLPGNMKPALIVNQPKNSRIYVRYINLLQRDALLKNFNIHVEKDLIDLDNSSEEPYKWNWDAFFGCTGENGTAEVYGLHTIRVPKKLRRNWIAEMRKHNHGIRFLYHAMTEIRFPQEWTDKLEKTRNDVIGQHANVIRALTKLNVSQGSVGGDDRTIPVLAAPFRITSPYGPRIHPISKEPSNHSGIDVGCPAGTPIYAPEDGVISNVHLVGGNTDTSIKGNEVVLKTALGRWHYLHLNSSFVKKGQVVKAGTPLGTTGSTGRSTGPHLHLTFYPNSGRKHADPLPYLASLLYQNEPNLVEPEAVSVFAPKDDLVVKASEEVVREALDTDEASVDALTELLTVLEEEGWKYYDKDTTVNNVWQKLLTLSIAHSSADVLSNGEQPPEAFLQEGIVLTNISAAITHIVANIPILSEEYPTQQHLGSIEPFYQLEFSVLDDQSNLEGISRIAQFVQSMRSLLQNNARKFRPVVDGWCLTADTFFTRLLGSYEENDILKYEENDKIVDYDIKKRITITSGNDGTVPGHPGLSYLRMNLEETNPYDTEYIKSTSPVLEDKDASREQILNALYKLDFIDKYKKSLLPILLAQLTGANTAFPDNEDYGKFSLYVHSPLGALIDESSISPGLNAFILEKEGEKYFLIRKQSDSDKDLFEYITGKPVDSASFVTEYNDFNVIPFSEIESLIADEGFGRDQPILVTEGSSYHGAQERFDRSNNYFIGEKNFDISRLLREDIEFGSVPVAKIRDYWVTLDKVIKTGNRIFAEEEIGGIPNSEITQTLYNLPFKNNMWKSWQAYLEAFAYASPSFYSLGYDGSTSLKHLRQNPNWPRPQYSMTTEQALYPEKRLGWSNTLSENEKNSIFALQNNFYGWFGMPTGAFHNLDNAIFGFLGSTAGAAAFSDVDVSYAWRSMHESAIQRLVDRYMRAFPIQIGLPETIKQQYNNVFGELLGNITDEGNKVPALQTMSESLYKNAYSCGNITALRLNGNPYFQTTESDPYHIPRSSGSDLVQTTGVRQVRGGAFGASDLISTPFIEVPELALTTVTGGRLSLIELRERIQSGTLSTIDDLVGTDLEALLYPKQSIGLDLNSPFEYPVDQSGESLKIRYIKSLLATLADDLLTDPKFLRAFGLENLALTTRSSGIVGSEAYPDLILPTHPYYGDTFQVSPDFYLWNIYEDGGALSLAQQDEIFQRVYQVIDNSYQSMKNLQTGSTRSDLNDMVLQEPDIDNPIEITTMVNAEASDSQNDGSGHTEMIFTPSDKAKSAVALFNDVVADPKLTSPKPSDMLDGVRLGASEGIYGAGGGIQYPTRTSPDMYLELQKKFEQTESMFGSKEGYLKQNITKATSPEIYQLTQGTNFERPIESAHGFDLESLKFLAKDSSKDLLSYKKSVRRAYPTLKLFFVEEDEFESRFLNFDDFHSYNGVKSFTYVSNSKLPADHCTITLQNVAGTLDGTKRNAIVDLDYFDKTADQRLTFTGDKTRTARVADEAIQRGTAQDQPFGAVVLRPGLNVQLRAGYSNDPDNLEVLISGRVVDVTWNKSGDLAEVLVQSFGTELIQQIKGTTRDGSDITYYTTHQLLGAMMLEPEVVHFGRWEFGQLFQIGEATDSRLDFTDYSREGYMGRFQVTQGLTSWIINHPFLLFGASLGMTASSFLPLGRIFGTGKFAGKVLGKFGFTTALGKGGMTKLFTSVVGREGLDTAVTAGEKVLLRKAAFEATENLARFSQSKVGTDDFAKNVAKMVGSLASELDVAKTLGESVEAAAKYERFLQTVAFKGQWMVKPWVNNGGVSYMSAIGNKPLYTMFNRFIAAPVKPLAAAATAGLVIDTMVKPLISMAYDNTAKAVRNFFTRTKSHLMLTPQDDNLYPPHPKDYMRPSTRIFEWILPGFAAEAAGSVLELVTDLAGKALFFSNDAGEFALGYMRPKRFIDKKVSPESCRYHIVSSTIWDIFYEMTLRHPGWIRAVRSYGTEFRYTMFFGIPSQRYWSKGASNQFIQRANDLRTYLEGTNGPEVSLDEFKMLYGEDLYNDLEKQIDQYFFSRIDPETILNTMGALAIPAIEKAKAEIIKRELTAIPLREYLRALEIRFVPFRKYHMLTSETDIVWNGIMSSEQNVANAIDVTYYEKPAEDASDQSTIRTTLIKAHAFLPEHMIRTHPIQYPNCISADMASRYGMGELMHQMREMYRGELVVLGNPRIKPYDICILVDSYNDMVGPIEVEQVVHNFSHETGFITEIKPAAVVIGNEISSWPVLTAMKLFTLAVHDIESKYSGVTGPDGEFDPGITGLLGGIKSEYGSQKLFDSLMDEKYKDIFGEEGASLATDVFGKNPPNTTKIDNALGDVYSDIMLVNGVGALGAGAVGGAIGLNGFLKGLAGAGPEFNNVKQFIHSPKGMKFGSIALLGLGATAVGAASIWASNQKVLPSVAWLIGGPIIMMHCLRNEAVMVVPLMKNGHPIVSGLAYNDSSMIWNSFVGNLNRYVDDSVSGLTDMYSYYERYGTTMWRRVLDPSLENRTGETQVANFLGGAIE